VKTVLPADGDFISKPCGAISRLITLAYGPEFSPYELKGEPTWVDTDPYDFKAKVAPEDVPAWQKMDTNARRYMVRAALADALNLKLRPATESSPIYVLVVDKAGAKLTAHDTANDPAGAPAPADQVQWISGDEAVYTNATMHDLSTGIQARVDRKVIDRTGLTGHYDFHVKPIPLPHYDPKSPDAENADIPAVLGSVKALGLRLESSKADVTVLVLDHIDRPPTD
jgi:uncharacterized protein (TIGR03435 family)